MDHPCHKCGHNVEDGKAFCSQCGAPQIRVVLTEVAVPAALAIPGSEAAAENALDLGYSLASDPLPVPRLKALQPCALAAGISVLLMFLGLNPFVTVLVAGFLAVTFSLRRRQGPIPIAGGIRLGALTGVLVFSAVVILELLTTVALHKGAEMRAAMMDKVQQTVVLYPGPEAKSFLEFARSPNGFTILLIASLIFGLFAFIALGSIGGAIGASLLGKRGRSR